MAQLDSVRHLETSRSDRVSQWPGNDLFLPLVLQFVDRLLQQTVSCRNFLLGQIANREKGKPPCRVHCKIHLIGWHHDGDMHCLGRLVCLLDRETTQNRSPAFLRARVCFLARCCEQRRTKHWCTLLLPFRTIIFLGQQVTHSWAAIYYHHQS